MTPGTLAALAALIVALVFAAGIGVAAILHARRASRRLAELEAERAASPLVGRTVVVNTPRPDDQALRGVVTRELEDGGVVLAGAAYLDRVEVRGGGAEVREVPAGDVVVTRVAWVQLLNPQEV